MQLTDSNGNIYGIGGLEITGIDGKPKVPVIPATLIVNSTPITGGTAGRILFQGTGNVLQQSGNLFWDQANARLGIGTATPSFIIDAVGGDARFNGVRVGLGGNGSDTLSTAVGAGALNVNTSGIANTAIGYFTLSTNITGSNNTALGYFALRSSTQASNTGIGSTSFLNLSSGQNNTALGRNSARYIADGSTSLTIANQSIFIGAETKALADSQTNQIVIGYNAFGLGSNSVVLGNSSVTLTALRGNVLINTTTDAGFKLDVNGTARVVGQTTLSGVGNTSTTVALITQNSDAVAMFTVRNDGAIRLNLTSTGTTIYSYAGDENTVSTVGRNIAFSSAVTTQGCRGVIAISGVNFTATTSASVSFGIYKGFAPTSGTATFDFARIEGTINQTGGANGVTRGLYVNPTLTSAADFRAIETTVGKVCLNTTSGNTLIGTTTDAGFKLDVVGTARISGAVTLTSSLTVTSAMAAGQSLAVGTFSPAVASAQLEIVSTTRGFLPPRMTNAQRLAIASPAVGLIVYCTDSVEGLYINKSTGWTFII
jgi:hypothetical protein